MILKRTIAPLAALVAGVMLAACSQPSAPPAPQPTHAPGELIASIKAAGAHDDSVIRVAPLRDPAVKQLISQAHAAEAGQHYQTAATALDQALKLSPKSPDLLQERAQLAVRLGHYDEAEKLARRSYALGPKLGGLCARNWQTVLEMRRIADDAAGVEVARQARNQCQKNGPVRM
jgi:tetratricopeptide (TPR) repeat protein